MMSANEASDNDISKDKPGHMSDFEALARDIKNRASRCVGSARTEARHFREFFGTGVLAVKKHGVLLKRDSLLPEGDHPKNLFWALHFMKVYPKQSPGCLADGALAGAVDPKTHCKWVWAFIDAVANLVDTVVSFKNLQREDGAECHRTLFGGFQKSSCREKARTALPSMLQRELSIFFSTASSHPPRRRRPLQTQIVSERRLGAHDVSNDCTMAVDGTDFQIPHKGIAKKGNAFESHKYAGKSALRYELGVDILAGNLVRIQGPHPADEFTDNKIFNNVLRNFP